MGGAKRVRAWVELRVVTKILHQCVMSCGITGFRVACVSHMGSFFEPRERNKLEQGFVVERLAGCLQLVFQAFQMLCGGSGPPRAASVNCVKDVLRGEVLAVPVQVLVHKDQVQHCSQQAEAERLTSQFKSSLAH